MGIEPFLVASTVEGVHGPAAGAHDLPGLQTVIRRSQPLDVPTDFPRRRPAGATVKGAGCRACRQTGFRGRTGIYELMVTDDEIRDMCVQRVNASPDPQHAR